MSRILTIQLGDVLQPVLLCLRRQPGLPLRYMNAMQVFEKSSLLIIQETLYMIFSAIHDRIPVKEKQTHCEDTYRDFKGFPNSTLVFANLGNVR